MEGMPAGEDGDANEDGNSAEASFSKGTYYIWKYSEDISTSSPDIQLLRSRTNFVNSFSKDNLLFFSAKNT